MVTASQVRRYEVPHSCELSIVSVSLCAHREEDSEAHHREEADLVEEECSAGDEAEEVHRNRVGITDITVLGHFPLLPLCGITRRFW